MEDNQKYLDCLKKYNKLNAECIMQTLDSFGFRTKVCEIHTKDKYVEYCLKVVVGTNLSELEKHDKDLALALASPTGKVKIIAPIPGRSLVGIQVPILSKENIRKCYSHMQINNKGEEIKWTFKRIIVALLFFIADIIKALGTRLVESENKK